MNEQRIKKLAEWAGFKAYLPLKEKYFGVIYPNGEIKVEDYPDFPNSLDACFKWLVPKAHRELGDKEFFKFLMRWCIKIITDGNEALALCLAIEKLIK